MHIKQILKGKNRGYGVKGNRIKAYIRKEEDVMHVQESKWIGKLLSKTMKEELTVIFVHIWIIPQSYKAIAII
jgi:hypothetical protein